MRSLLVALLLIVCAIGDPVFADTSVFGENTGDSPGGTVEDTNIIGNWGLDDYNYGQTIIWHCAAGGSFGTRRAIIYADMSSIPTTATVTAATLTITHKHTACIGHNNSRTVRVQRILGGNATWWPEGTKDNAEAGTGEPDWTHKEHSATAWAGSAGLLTSGTDYTTTGEATATVGTSAGAVTLNILSIVQTWIATPSTNNGLVVSVDQLFEYVGFHSSEGTDGSRPYFTVTYTVPSGGPSTLRTVQAASSLRTVQTPSDLRTVQVEAQ